VKYKDAIRMIQNDNLSGDDLFRRVADMFGIEGDGRIQLRMGKNTKPSANLVRGVIEEMKPWITKVADGVGLPAESLKTLLDTEPGVMYSEWHVQDPRVTKINKRVHHGLMRGEAPIQNLRIGDIEALAAMSLGSMISDMREHVAKRDAFVTMSDDLIKQVAESLEYQQLIDAHDLLKETISDENAQNEYRCYRAVRELFFTAIKADLKVKEQLFLSGQITIGSETEAEVLAQKHHEHALELARKHIPLFAGLYDMLQKAKKQGML